MEKIEGGEIIEIEMEEGGGGFDDEENLEKYIWRVESLKIWKEVEQRMIQVMLEIKIEREIYEEDRFKGRGMIMRILEKKIDMKEIVEVMGVKSIYGRNGMIENI